MTTLALGESLEPGNIGVCTFASASEPATASGTPTGLSSNRIASHRTTSGPRQRVVVWLGNLDTAGRTGVQEVADGQDVSEFPRRQLTLFDEETVRRFERRIEERLIKMAERCEKQKRQPLKVEREVGHLFGQNTRAAKLFEVTVETTAEGHARLKWKKLESLRVAATLRPCTGGWPISSRPNRSLPAPAVQPRKWYYPGCESGPISDRDRHPRPAGRIDTGRQGEDALLWSTGRAVRRESNRRAA